MASVKVNEQAPDFSLPDFRGETFTLSDFRTKRLVLIVLNRGFA